MASENYDTTAAVTLREVSDVASRLGAVDGLDEYVSLHTHGTTSFLDGYGTPDQMRDRLLQLGQRACALTDHGNVYGWLEFHDVLSRAGIRPILGLEAYHVEDMTVRARPAKDAPEFLGDKRAHLTLIAGSEAGYRSVLAIGRESYERGFYEKPRIDWDCVLRNQAGVIVLSGCVGGMLSRQICAGKEDVAFKWMEWLSRRLERFYVEIVPCPSLPHSIVAVNALWRMATELGLPIVVTSDAHFPRPEDHVAEDTMLCSGIRKTMDDETRTLKIAAYHYMCSGVEILNRAVQVLPDVPLRDLAAAVLRTREVAESIEYDLPRSSGPLYALSPGKTALQEMREWVEEGKDRLRSLGKLVETDAYREREAYEMRIVEEKGFANYFLVVADIVRYVVRSGKLVIARGSAGGSLVCWYMGITQTDPILFDLPFERFLNPDRPDAPDIDLDFPSAFRPRVFEYLVGKYGEDRCGHVASLFYYRTNQAIRDVGNVYKVPPGVVNRLCSIVPRQMEEGEAVKTTGVLKRFFTESEEARAILHRYPDLKIAADLEGQMRHSTVHAAGFVVDSRPIHETCGVVRRPLDSKTSELGLPIVAATKDYVAKRGLLKIDVLSLDTLAIVEECATEAGMSFDDLVSLPYDDAGSYEMLASGANAGVFQLQGQAAAKLLRQLRPRDLHDVVAISVLARPGPLKSGGAQEYIDRKYGRLSTPRIHPLIEEIVRDTQYVIIYQEQIMRLVREVGGFDWLTVHKIRKMVTDTSFGSKDMDAHLPAYLEGAAARGVPEDQARHYWVQCQKAGDYAFNKAHGYQYGIVGYWTAWFKNHYPAVFTATAAKYEDDPTERVKLFLEFQKAGGVLRFLDPDESRESFRALDARTLVGGFSDIAGIGPKTAAKLIAGQPYGSWSKFLASLTPSLRSIVESTGAAEGALRVGSVLRVAPWYLATDFDEIESAFFRLQRCTSASEVERKVASGELRGEVRVGGRVVALAVEDLVKSAARYGRTPPAEGEPRYRAKVTVADATGAVTVDFPAHTWSGVVRCRQPEQGSRGDGVGNVVMVSGDVSYDGQRVWGRDLFVVTPLGATRAQETAYDTTEDVRDVPVDADIIECDTSDTKLSRHRGESCSARQIAVL